MPQLKIYDNASGTWKYVSQMVQLVNHAQMLWSVEGTNLSTTGVKPLKIRAPYVGTGATIEEIYLQLGTAPASTAVRINVLKNGSTILSGTTYVEIAKSQTTASRTTNFASTAMAKDDYFQFEVVQGDATAADLLVHLRYKWALTQS